MSQTDIPALYARFVTLCEAYAHNPDLVTGLALGEAAERLEQACARELGDTDLRELLQRLLRAVPSGDMADFHRLLDAIRGAALERNLA